MDEKASESTNKFVGTVETEAFERRVPQSRLGSVHFKQYILAQMDLNIDTT
jgi:hypothetical protein